MERIIEEPTMRKEDGPMKGEVYSHPAFAQIRATRGSGYASLYGSDFKHQNYVTVTICASQLHRSLSNDWMFSREQYIEVAMSESQWATFVSSMNVGSGPGCTLTYLQGKQIAELPSPASKKKKFQSEAEELCAEALSKVDELKAMIEESGLSKKAKELLSKKVDSVKQSMASSLPYVEKQFGEHMEATVEKAKMEINAYATGAIMRAGIKSLGGDESIPLIELGGPHE